MEISNLIPHIEALIFASEKPLTTLEITDLINQAFGFMEDKIVLDQIESAIEGILEKYKAEFYPFEVRESGGGWQFLTKRDFHKTVAQLNGDKFLKRLSTAALETLSIIAYKQPVTKSEIEAIRGVSSDYAIQKLLEKDLIVITGRNETLPGHPLVYATSKNFMDYFGLNSAEDLPKLKEIFDDSFVAPTMVGDVTIVPATEGEDVEETTPSLNGTYLNGTDVTSEEERVEGEEENAAADLGQDIVNENAEATEEAYELDTDEEAIAEEAEALDEEAGEVFDEIAEEGYDEEGDEEEAFGEEEGEEEGFEEEGPYITPEEEEEAYADDDTTTFKVGEDGELIEEHSASEEEDEEEEFNEEEEEGDDKEPGDEEGEDDKDDEKK